MKYFKKLMSRKKYVDLKIFLQTITGNGFPLKITYNVLNSRSSNFAKCTSLDFVLQQFLLTFGGALYVPRQPPSAAWSQDYKIKNANLSRWRKGLTNKVHSKFYTRHTWFIVILQFYKMCELCTHLRSRGFAQNCL